jgi:putative transposase
MRSTAICLPKRCRKASVGVWAYCLMPNHVHLVLTPATSEGLARAIGETHRQYTGFINARARWTGHLFQGRFSSVALDNAHLVAAARYVALNPVRARLVACAEDWAWSSARAHLAGRDDGLVRVAPLLDRIGRFCDLIDSENGRLAFAALRASKTTGRALGSGDFLATLERATARRLRPKKAGAQAERADGSTAIANAGYEQRGVRNGRWVRCPRNSPQGSKKYLHFYVAEF